MQAALQLPPGLPMDIRRAAASLPISAAALAPGSAKAQAWERAAALAQLQPLERGGAMHAALHSMVLDTARSVQRPSALQLSYTRYGNPQVRHPASGIFFAAFIEQLGAAHHMRDTMRCYAAGIFSDCRMAMPALFSSTLEAYHCRLGF